MNKNISDEHTAFIVNVTSALKIEAEFSTETLVCPPTRLCGVKIQADKI